MLYQYNFVSLFFFTDNELRIGFIGSHWSYYREYLWSLAWCLTIAQSRPIWLVGRGNLHGAVLLVALATTEQVAAVLPVIGHFVPDLQPFMCVDMESGSWLCPRGLKSVWYVSWRDYYTLRDPLLKNSQTSETCHCAIKFHASDALLCGFNQILSSILLYQTLRLRAIRTSSADQRLRYRE